jgi:hypothetical protein
MREFNQKPPSPKGALRRLDPGARLVYAGFLAFLFCGLIAAVLLHYDGMGVSAATATAYWRGDESQMVYPKSYRQILELTHFHLFTEPVVWLVVAHLYHLGRGRGWISMGTLAAIGAQIALPWAVAYATPAVGVLLLPITAAVVLGLGFMIVDSLYELWCARSPSSSPS